MTTYKDLRGEDGFTWDVINEQVCGVEHTLSNLGMVYYGVNDDYFGNRQIIFGLFGSESRQKLPLLILERFLMVADKDYKPICPQNSKYSEAALAQQ